MPEQVGREAGIQDHQPVDGAAGDWKTGMTAIA